MRATKRTIEALKPGCWNEIGQSGLEDSLVNYPGAPSEDAAEKDCPNY